MHDAIVTVERIQFLPSKEERATIGRTSVPVISERFYVQIALGNCENATGDSKYLKGTLHYQVGNDHKSYYPRTIEFSIPISAQN